jgi:hypothetical protein
MSGMLEPLFHPDRVDHEALMIRTAHILRRIGLALALALAVCAACPSSGFAFSSEAREQCTGDAFRLCAGEIPNIPKITACMRKNKSNLSPGCRAVMDKDDAAAKSAKVATRG